MRPRAEQVAAESPALAPPQTGRVVARLQFSATDAEILTALLDGKPMGGAALYDRYGRLVRSVLRRLVGMGADLDDLVQETFIAAIRNIRRVHGPELLRPWLTSVAVFTARDEIKRRVRRRFFHLRAPEELPEVAAPCASPEGHESVRAVYAILEKLPPDDRIAFTLRFIEGMALEEVAAVCKVSLATIKRRIARGRSRFDALAIRSGQLSDWIGEGESR